MESILERVKSWLSGQGNGRENFSENTSAHASDPSNGRNCDLENVSVVRARRGEVLGQELAEKFGDVYQYQNVAVERPREPVEYALTANNEPKPDSCAKCGGNLLVKRGKVWHCNLCCFDHGLSPMPAPEYAPRGQRYP